MQLEALLEYFHVTCKPAVADMCERVRVKLLSNVDVAATEGMVRCQDLQSELNECLIHKTFRYHKQIAVHMWKNKMPWPKGFVPEVDGDPDPRRAWIDFPAHWRKLRARTHATRVTALAVPTPLSTNPTMAWIELPWKAWLEEGRTVIARYSRWQGGGGGSATSAAQARAYRRFTNHNHGQWRRGESDNHDGWGEWRDHDPTVRPAVNDETGEQVISA